MKKVLYPIGLFVFAILLFAYSIHSIGSGMKKSNENQKEILRLEKEKITLEIKILKKECCC